MNSKNYMIIMMKEKYKTCPIERFINSIKAEISEDIELIRKIIETESNELRDESRNELDEIKKRILGK